MEIITPLFPSGTIFRCQNCATLRGSITDAILVAGGQGKQVSSVLRPFTASDIGYAAIVTAGVGFTIQGLTQSPYIVSVTNGVATLSAIGTIFLSKS